MTHISLIILFVILNAWALWNIAVFCVYAADKSGTKKKKRGINEKTLLYFAFFMGGAGSFLGMNILRHKNNQTKFKMLLLLAIVCNALVIAAMMYLFLQYG